MQKYIQWGNRTGKQKKRYRNKFGENKFLRKTEDNFMDTKG